MSFMADLIRQKQNFRWRRRNKHNRTKIEYASKLHLIEMGNYIYGSLNVINEGNEYKLKVGHFCSIAPGVRFIVHGDHPADYISKQALIPRFIHGISTVTAYRKNKSKISGMML